MCLEAFYIDHLDAAALIPDDPVALQRAGYLADRGTLGAQHIGKEFVGK